MEIYEMPWYNNQEVQTLPQPLKNENIVKRLRNRVSKKVVVATAATLGTIAAVAATVAAAKSRSNGNEGGEGFQEEADIIEFPTTDQVEAN